MLRWLLAPAFLALLACGGSGSPTSTKAPVAHPGTTLLAQIPSNGVAGCWGYTTPTGERYALMGTAKGILVVDLRLPTSPRIVDEVAGPTNTPFPGIYWREMRVFGHYAYIVSEQTNVRGGVMILDLAGLPNSVRYVKSALPRDGRLNAHTLDIDPETGLLYLQRYTSLPAPGGPLSPHHDPEDALGGNATEGSVDIYSLADPENPTHLTTFNQNIYIHDMTTRRGFCYVAEGLHNSFSIWDVRTPTHPTLVTRWNVAAGHFAHNIWPSPDATHVVTTEELPEGLPARIWKLNGAAEPSPIASFQQGTATPHNAIWLGSRIFLSHYTEGLAIVDVSSPSLPTLKGRYDTNGFSGPALEGCWGVYPFPDGQTVIGSDISTGLHLIRVDN